MAMFNVRGMKVSLVRGWSFLRSLRFLSCLTNVGQIPRSAVCCNLCNAVHLKNITGSQCLFCYSCWFKKMTVVQFTLTI
jgi:hypothetical protein